MHWLEFLICSKYLYILGMKIKTWKWIVKQHNYQMTSLDEAPPIQSRCCIDIWLLSQTAESLIIRDSLVDCSLKVHVGL